MNNIEKTKEPLKVLVTRPEPKGQALISRLHEAGFEASAFAVFHYKTTEHPKKCKLLLTLHEQATLIFVSVAAVTYANKITPASSWKFSQVFAVGQATQQALAALNINAICPELENSEGLLALNGLQNVHQQNVILVRGDSGREFLYQQLKARNAKVHYAQSYQRQWQEITLQQAHYWQQAGINCIVNTSVAMLEKMVNSLTTVDPYWQNTCYWVVSSARIAECALSLGLKHVINTQSANNQRLLQTIIKMENNHD